MTLPRSIPIIGAGLAGTLMATLLARRGRRVTLYEARPDPRVAPWAQGRSINLALADRGTYALDLAGVLDSIRPLLIPMRGRMLHDLQGGTQLAPYGQRSHEVIYSVSRPGLNLSLLEHAERAGVDLVFDHRCAGIDLEAQHLIAADGAGSVLRQVLTQRFGVEARSEMLAHGYKELTIPARNGQHALDPNALHVWPRGGFMLIALPNRDGSFTATLFLALEGAESFAQLASDSAVESFFERHFPDARALMPELAAEFAANPVGELGTVYCDQWAFADRAVLIGDAAHAIVPFHGQGMNCAFEDCVALDRELAANDDWATACAAFARDRRPQTDAIAAMALENYLEMRDTVRDPTFQLQRALSLELERRFPERFIPRYSMVMFHHEIPYATAFERGKIQAEILSELTSGKSELSTIAWERARTLVDERLTPISGEEWE
jgi:kynurenine 3-monooxygenase